MINLFYIIAFYGILRGITADSSTIQPQTNNELIWSKDQCDNYCFDLVKPLLNHFTGLKEQIDTYDEMKDKNFKLERELENSKIQNEAKDNLLNEKVDQLKGKEALINEQDDIIKDLRSQLRKECKQEEENLPDTCPTSSSRIQRIQINGLQPFEVPCISPSSGWTVIQRRINGSVDFHRDWLDYKMGFGDIRGEFFIGLEKLHLMTQSKPHELYILMRDINGTTKYARYDNFNVGSEIEKFKLNTVGSYKGSAGDSLSQHVGYMFTTRDQDNDLKISANCGNIRGGWWYHDCAHSFLNGKYHQNGIAQLQGIAWGSWKNWDYSISLTFTQMMIRPTFQLN